MGRKYLIGTGVMSIPLAGMKINQLSASKHGKEMSYKFHLRCSLIKSFVVGMGRHCLLDKRSLGGQLVGLAIRCSSRSGKHKNFTRESEIFDQQCNGLSGCISYQVTS